MDTEEKRLRIAEATGWNYHKRESWPKRRPKQFEYILQAPNQELKVLPEYTVATASYEHDRIIGLKRLPDYFNDRDAIAEAVASLTDRQKHAYAVMLGLMFFPNGWQSWQDTLAVAEATAAQRCEALLKALEV